MSRRLPLTAKTPGPIVQAYADRWMRNLRFLDRQRRAQAKRDETAEVSGEKCLASLLEGAGVVPDPPSPRFLDHIAKTKAKPAPVPGPNADAWARKRFDDARRAANRPAPRGGRTFPYGMGALALALLATAGAPERRDGDLVE